MIHYSIPEHPPTPRAHRRFRAVIALLVAAVVVVLVLQYTPYHLVPAAKTSSLWGALVGLVAMTGYAEYKWASKRNRD